MIKICTLDNNTVDGITDSMNMSFGKRREIVKYREAWRAAVHRTAESDIATEQPHTSMLKKEEKNTPNS